MLRYPVNFFAGTSVSGRSFFKAKSQLSNKPIPQAGMQLIQDAFANEGGQGYWQAHAQGVSVKSMLLDIPS